MNILNTIMATNYPFPRLAEDGRILQPAIRATRRGHEVRQRFANYHMSLALIEFL